MIRTSAIKELKAIMYYYLLVSRNEYIHSSFFKKPKFYNEKNTPAENIKYNELLKKSKLPSLHHREGSTVLLSPFLIIAHEWQSPPVKIKRRFSCRGTTTKNFEKTVTDWNWQPYQSGDVHLCQQLIKQKYIEKLQKGAEVNNSDFGKKS